MSDRPGWKAAGTVLAAVLVAAVVGLGAYFVNVAATKRSHLVITADCQRSANFERPPGSPSISPHRCTITPRNQLSPSTARASTRPPSPVLRATSWSVWCLGGRP